MDARSADRRFGFLMAGVLVAVAGHVAYRHGHAPVVAAWAIAAVLLAGLALLRPQLLNPLHRAWLAIGAKLGAVMGPVILGLLYFLLLTPVGLLARLWGRDELRLRKSATGSHWRQRVPTGPAPDSLKHQY